jgi:hypothetical protein
MVISCFRLTPFVLFVASVGFVMNSVRPAMA